MTITPKVTAFLDAFSRRAIADCLALLEEEGEIDLPFAGPAIGREAMERQLLHFFRRFDADCTDRQIMTDRMPSRAAVEITWKGQYLVSEAGLPDARGQRFSVAAGLFIRGGDDGLEQVRFLVDQAELIRQLEAGASD